MEGVLQGLILHWADKTLAKPGFTNFYAKLHEIERIQTGIFNPSDGDSWANTASIESCTHPGPP
jgi:hypothetical protein